MHMNTNSMLEETGQVIALEGEYAIIETQQRSSCGQCKSADSCGTSVLSGLFKAHRNQVRVKNHLGLSVGDKAVIGINESILLSTAALAYMLPLIIMILLSVITSLSGVSDNMSFVAGLLGLFSGMKIANHIMARSQWNNSNEIVLLRNANEPLISISS